MVMREEWVVMERKWPGGDERRVGGDGEGTVGGDVE